MATYKRGVMEIPFGRITKGILQECTAEKGVSVTTDTTRNHYIITFLPARVPVAVTNS